jgi:hypothetical protein
MCWRNLELSKKESVKEIGVGYNKSTNATKFYRNVLGGDTNTD